MLRRILLACGILSSLFYVAITLVTASRYEGYSSASQTISELSAIGVPTRPLWVLLSAVYSLLVTAFGWGVWRSATRNRPLRVTGGLIMAGFAITGLVWPFAPMHTREVLAAGGGTLSDTMHIALAVLTVVPMSLAIVFGAMALGKRFRLYSIKTMVILVGFGALTGLDSSRMSANLPTPWMGVWERISIGAFLLWIVVLAFTLLRVRDAQAGPV